MSKRQIEAALRCKGLSCAALEYNHQVTPGEVIGGWEIELDDRSEELVAAIDPAFDNWEPDCFNAAEALEWVASLPNCQAPPPAEISVGALTCQCANTITDPCLICGKGKTLATAEWLQKMADKEGDLDPTTGRPEPRATGPTLEDFARRLFDLHGFMLLETYKGKHAVTVTFPDLAEAQQFHGTLVELSTHRPRPRSLMEGSDNG